MSRRYGHPIAVTCGSDGAPERLTWRGTTYRVAEVLGNWHLCDRWWQPETVSASTCAPSAARVPTSADVSPHLAPGASAGGVRDVRPATPYHPDASGASDRTYFRLRCREGLLCDVYHDAVAAQWVLDRVHD